MQNETQNQSLCKFGFFRLSKSKMAVDVCSNTLRGYNAQGLPFYKVGKNIFVNYANLNHSSGKRMNSKINSTELFDEDSAAAYIGGIKARTIRAWRANRGLPFIRITAKTIRIRRADLDEWLARHRVAIS